MPSALRGDPLPYAAGTAEIQAPVNPDCESHTDRSFRALALRAGRRRPSRFRLSRLWGWVTTVKKHGDTDSDDLAVLAKDGGSVICDGSVISISK